MAGDWLGFQVWESSDCEDRDKHDPVERLASTQFGEEGHRASEEVASDRDDEEPALGNASGIARAYALKNNENYESNATEHPSDKVEKVLVGHPSEGAAAVLPSSVPEEAYAVANERRAEQHENVDQDEVVSSFHGDQVGSAHDPRPLGNQAARVSKSLVGDGDSGWGASILEVGEMGQGESSLYVAFRSSVAVFEYGTKGSPSCERICPVGN